MRRLMCLYHWAPGFVSTICLACTAVTLSHGLVSHAAMLHAALLQRLVFASERASLVGFNIVWRFRRSLFDEAHHHQHRRWA